MDFKSKELLKKKIIYTFKNKTKKKKKIIIKNYYNIFYCNLYLFT